MAGMRIIIKRFLFFPIKQCVLLAAFESAVRTISLTSDDTESDSDIELF